MEGVEIDRQIPWCGFSRTRLASQIMEKGVITPTFKLGSRHAQGTSKVMGGVGRLYDSSVDRRRMGQESSILV